MGIQICSNEASCPFSRGEDYELAKCIDKILEFFFFRITGPISIKLGTKHPWMKWIKICSNEEKLPFNFHKGNNGYFLLLINVN